MAKVSYAQLNGIVSSVVTAAKISNGTFSATRDNVAGLLDKIGKILTLDTVYTIDKLASFDGEYLSFGKTIEEWQQDLILPETYSSSGVINSTQTALSPFDPTYRPVFYSYTVGRKVIPTSIRNDDLERAVHFQDQFISLVAMQYKRLEDSMAVYRYEMKREMIARLYSFCYTAMNSTTTFSASTSYTTIGSLFRDANPATKHGILVKAYTANAAANWAAAVAGGWIIELDLITDIAIPTDATTGAAFVTQVKKDVEIAQDLSEGHSLNGNSLGVVEDLVLIVKQGVIPAIEVDTYAGAFNKQDVTVPARIIVVKDFGSDTTDANFSKVYAVLMDGRGMRLHNTYNATRENGNGLGDWLSLFRHTEDTAYISRNTFVKFYKNV